MADNDVLGKAASPPAPPGGARPAAGGAAGRLSGPHRRHHRGTDAGRPARARPAAQRGGAFRAHRARPVARAPRAARTGVRAPGRGESARAPARPKVDEIMGLTRVLEAEVRAAVRDAMAAVITAEAGQRPKGEGLAAAAWNSQRASTRPRSNRAGTPNGSGAAISPRGWTPASPRSASSCRRRTSPACCTWATRSTRRSWTRSRAITGCAG